MRVVVALACASCSFHPGGRSGGDAAASDSLAQQDGTVFSDGPPPDWWDPAWLYRMRLTIRDPVALAAGFQVGFAQDLDAAPCTGSRDGVRVVWNKTEIARVVDETGNPQWIWFRLQAPIAANATSIEYWLYCHNPAAGPAPADPTTVFDAYDDFSANSLGPMWASAGTVTVGSGVALLQNNATFHSTMTYPVGTATDFAMSPQAGPPNMWFWGGFQNGTATAAPWTLWNTRNENGIHPELNDGAGGTASGSLTSFDTSSRLYGVENYGVSSMYRLNDAPVATVAHPSPITQSIAVRFDNYSSTSTMRVDMARVRKAVDPPPTVAVGPAETFTP